VSVPLAFGLAYAVADSVALALERVQTLQLWIGGSIVLVAAAWVILRWRRPRGE
jgi:hypothetical protein